LPPVTTIEKPQTGRRERRRMETREKIFRAAMQLFAERGFFQTTTEDITEAADVGQGTFFNYFPTKQHVLTVLTEKQMGWAMLARQEADAGKLSIHDVLNRLMHNIAQEPGKSQALTRSLMAAFLSNDEVRKFVRDTMARGREHLGEIIKLGQRRGELRLELKPPDVALAFQRNVIGTLLLWAMQTEGDLDAWIEKTFYDFWSAVESREQVNNRGQGIGDRLSTTADLRQKDNNSLRQPSSPKSASQVIGSPENQKPRAKGRKVEARS